MDLPQEKELEKADIEEQAVPPKLSKPHFTL